MAYVDDSQEQTDQESKPEAPSTSGSATPAATKGNFSAATPGANAPKQPFQNISAYLGANGPQAEQTGQNIAGTLNQQAQSTQGAIDSASAGFKNNVTAATPVVSSEQIATAAAHPTQITADQGLTKTFQNLYNNPSAYTGPSSFTGSPEYSDVSSKVQSAKDTGTLVNSGFGGIQQYLQKNNPNYTAGQSTLDTLLLQGTPKALESIQSGGKALTGLEDPFNASVAQNDAFAQSAAQKTAQESQDVTSALQGVGTNLTNNLNTKTQGDVQKLTSLQSKLADDMSKNDAIALKNDLEASGVPKDVLQTLLERLSAEGTYKVPLSQNGELVKGSPTDFNLANEASPEDYANSAAWASLTGQQMPLDQANAAQAGKAPAVSPDVTSFLNNAQGIIGEKDRGLLQAPSNALSNAAQLVGAQDIIANPGDGPSGQSIANAFIQAIQRNGPENAPAANAAYDQALKQFALLGGRQTDTAVSGLYQFLTRMAPILGRNDFGQPADGLTPPSDPTSPGIIAPFTGEGQTPKLYSGNV